MTAIQEPEFLWLEITGKCQLRCVHCYADSGPDGTHGSMGTADWMRVIDEAATMGVRRVQFIGGEPTLYPDLAGLIRHALSHALQVEVFSNLVHVSDELWEVFALPGVRLATSYYSADEAEHRRITGRATHPRTRANIAEAVRRGIPLRAGVIDVRGGRRDRDPHAQLRELGVARIGEDRLRAIGRPTGERAGGTASELCGGCGNGRAAVLPDGSVTPCVMSRWASMGNVRHHDLSTALAELPGARAALSAAGMPARAVTGCGPDDDECPPYGDDCYPMNK